MDSQAKPIQWFPGHMTKTKRKIQESLKLVDVAAELIDARIPLSSRNPVLAELLAQKPRVILLNKCDMADPKETQKWISFFVQQKTPALALDCKSGKGLGAFTPTVKELLQDRMEQWKAKGMVGRTIRVMIVGIPNVGKSSFINKMAKGTKAKVEDRPGVTRGNQWYSIGQGMELLDTPGVLWPKFEDPNVGEKLAFTGAVKDQITDTEYLAAKLLEELVRLGYVSGLRERFKLADLSLEELPGYELLERIGRKRGMLISGGEVDLERASVMVLDEFRACKLGKVTLEPVPQEGDQ